MRTRSTLWWCLGGAALLALLIALWQPKPPPPPTLQTPDGAVYVAGTTFGTNHVLGPPLARFAARSVGPLRWLIERFGGRHAQPLGSTTMSPPGLVVWVSWTTNSSSPQRATNGPVEPSQPPFSFFEAMISDTNGFVSGESAFLSLATMASLNPRLEPVRFNVFPRRDPTNFLHCYQQTGTGLVYRGSLPFRNPVYRRYPTWTPEPLPATKRVEDVEATLTKVSTGLGSSSTQRSLPGGGTELLFSTNRTWGGHNSTVCFLRLRSLSDTNQVWTVANEELSDATGNVVRNSSLSSSGASSDCFTFEPGLWTNESAWKLKCEIKRFSGFSADETFTLSSVPLGEIGGTNRLRLGTNFHGVTVTLTEVVRRAPRTNNSWSSVDLSQFGFQIAGLASGQHLDLISARSDLGTNLESVSWSSSGSSREYGFRNLPREARTADLTFAVQKSRWVEFMVKPEVGPARLVRE